VRSPLDEVAELFARNASSFEDAVLELTRQAARRHFEDWPGAEEERRAQNRIATVGWQTMALSDLLGRRRLVLEAAAARKGVPDSLIGIVVFAETPVVPHVPFEEAVRDLVSRTPALARSAAQVERVYRAHGFAMARSASLQVTKHVQGILAELMREGVTLAKAEDLVARAGNFARAYAETVYRTNMNTAYSAGRFMQARDPDVAAVIGGLERVSVLDSDVRPNHAAGHGLVASVNDPVWGVAAPPSGYNCRCSAIFTSKGELRRRGLLDVKTGRVRRYEPPGFRRFHPDPGFRASRPDTAIYGGQGL